MRHFFPEKNGGQSLFTSVVQLLISIFRSHTFLACENNTYGINCSETCGHCRDNDECFHSNNACLYGCDAGYQGYLCKTRE